MILKRSRGRYKNFLLKHTSRAAETVVLHRPVSGVLGAFFDPDYGYIFIQIASFFISLQLLPVQVLKPSVIYCVFFTTYFFPRRSFLSLYTGVLYFI